MSHGASFGDRRADHRVQGGYSVDDGCDLSASS
jgi:hypothetical protein